MNISIKNTLITIIDFKIFKDSYDKESDTNTGRFTVKFDLKYFDDKPNIFVVVFHISILDKDELFKLDISLDATFETDEEIDDDFKSSSFPNINAPAIGYPFIRAQVANITLNAGIDPIMLPTINFTTFNKEPKKDSDNSIVE